MKISGRIYLRIVNAMFLMAFLFVTSVAMAVEAIVK